MTIDNLFHEGELTVQNRASEVESALKNGSIMSKYLPPRAIDFIAQQPMVIVGSVAPNGRVWASALFGKPGFLQAQEDRTLRLTISQSFMTTDDPLWNNVNHKPQVGLLLIDLTSRRRLRINGVMRHAQAADYVFDVERVYPNCPKYIQRRQWKMPAAATTTSTKRSRRGKQLDAAQQTWIAQADTFFVASAHPEQGVDASHRGGLPGFVQVLNQAKLRIPDYAGNSMFNTLGNFVSHPHAGLVFLDFDGGRVLQLSGRPEILWDLDDPQGDTGGTHRYWEFEVENWQERKLPFHLAWELLDYSPLLPVPKDM